MKIYIIGSGNVAHHMARAVEKTEHSILGAYSRNKVQVTSISKNTTSDTTSIPIDADVYLICISDDAIVKVVQQIPELVRKTKIIAHTSGSRPITDLSGNCKFSGIFYPLQTFSKSRSMDYSSIPFCINGNSESVKGQLTTLAKSISESVQLMDDEQRKHIHLSAVTMNNFVNHLIYKSEQQLQENDINPSILQPLLLETIKKQANIGALDAQTGPARRNDKKTIASHLDLLKNKSDKKVYKALSKSIIKTYK